MTFDDDPLREAVHLAFSSQRLTDRGIDELIGICKGVLSDGAVVDSEATFLLEWMDSNRSVSDKWPASVIYPRIKAMLVDRTLDPEEQGELLDLLVQLTGGSGSTDPVAPNLSTSRPRTDPAPEITYAGKQFCLTGRFALGTRKQCEALITELGGRCQRGAYQDTDYLVVGTVSSSSWMHSTHGRKIESAVALRKNGCPIAIVSEEHWARSLRLQTSDYSASAEGKVMLSDEARRRIYDEEKARMEARKQIEAEERQRIRDAESQRLAEIQAESEAKASARKNLAVVVIVVVLIGIVGSAIVSVLVPTSATLPGASDSSSFGSEGAP